MGFLPLSYLLSRATKSVPCRTNCSPPRNLNGLGALVIIVFLAVLLGVYFYKLNKAKRLHRTQGTPYSKGKIFLQAFLAASVVGLIVLFCEGGSNNSDAVKNDPAAEANAPGPAGGGGDPSMEAQLREEGTAMNLNNMANQSTSLAAQDGVLG